MTRKFTNMTKNFAYYENYIQTHFIVQDCGINLKQIGKKTQEIYFSTVSIGQSYFYFEAKNRLSPIVDFIEKTITERPLWYRINVIDQALNDYIGIGHLNIESGWLEFILDYLEKDRAEQFGDTICILFDCDFKWAVSFTFSQNKKRLIVEKYES